MSYIGASPTSAAFLTNSFSGDGTTTSFTLTVAPASSSSILVAVSGVLQDPATYAVVGTSLNFTGAPPSGTANIIVRFLGIPASNIATASYRTVTEFTATAAQTTFSVPSYTPGFIDVYRNGVMLGSADYTATNGTTVVLASGATAGDLIETISFYVSSIYNAISNTAGSVNANNIADGAVGTAEIADGAVTTAKLAATTGSGNVVLSAAPTLTGQATIPTVNLTGGQITFPATQVPSSDANTLDDYEEGTWTPSVGGTATYNGSYGRYVKIGRWVTVQFNININVLGTGNTNQLQGLPFASANISSVQTGICSYFANIGQSTAFLGFYVENNATTCQFVGQNAIDNTCINGVSVFQNSSDIYGYITYMAAA